MPPLRREELDGFVEGLFGTEQSLEFPERAHRAVDILSDLRVIFDGLYELAGNPTKPVTADDIAQARRNIRELNEGGRPLDPRSGVFPARALAADC